MNIAWQDFDQVDGALARAEALTGAAESQGMLCGMVCARGSLEAGTWLEQVLAETDPRNLSVQECRPLLEALYQGSVQQLHDSGLGFQLLLPDDQAALDERAIELGRWCQGFLFGLGLGGISADDELPGEVGEILRDFSEISRVQFDMDDMEEDAEDAYAEIVEYVRVGVLLILEEIQPIKAPPRLQ